MGFMKARDAVRTGDVARWCGVTVRTVLNWIEQGLLPAYRLPGRGDNRVRVPALLEFLTRHDIPIPEALRPQSRRVLVVEDDPDAARLAADSLKRIGFEPRIARDGFSAGVELAAFCPDLVALDLRMPGMDGLQVLRYIRSQKSLRHLKVLVITGAPRDEVDDALAAGADDYLQKPVEPKALREKVARLLETRTVPSKMKVQRRALQRGG